MRYCFILILLISTIFNANITSNNDGINIVEKYNPSLIIGGDYLYDLAVDYYEKNNILSFCLSSLAISKNLKYYSLYFMKKGLL
ncbi:hypothetical protein A6A20_11475 [Volucribacter amazonae]|uniref:Uncharacterized protein n=1 Tax=Volucribacter amazonae TaxID=256731 RepID=A0A9X4SLJ0_9PAST|nr:hypothetical protein [Volucribacter amazonae]